MDMQMTTSRAAMVFAPTVVLPYDVPVTPSRRFSTHVLIAASISIAHASTSVPSVTVAPDFAFAPKILSISPATAAFLSLVQP